MVYYFPTEPTQPAVDDNTDRDSHLGRETPTSDVSLPTDRAAPSDDASAQLSPVSPTSPRTPRGYGPGSMRPLSSGRPQSAVSRTSMSHATIASTAFFRPMSSRRLQAQRTRPTTAASQEGHRLSMSTAGPRGSMDSEEPPLPERRFDLIGAPVSPTSSEATARAGDKNRAPDNSAHDTNVHKTWRESEEEAQVVGTTRHDTSGRKLTTPKTPKSYYSSHRLNEEPHVPQVPQSERVSNETGSPILQEKQAGTPPKSKNYEHFSGNTAFCCGGRVQNTRQRPVNIITGLAILAPAALYGYFSAEYLWFRLSPAVPSVFAYLFLICMSSFIHASVSDPGIVPRNLQPIPPAQTDDPLEIPTMTEWAVIKSFSSKQPAMYFPIKYCKTCNIWRGPRTHHCRICDNCVDTQDHHCVWLNNCIGRRNYRYFITFLSTATILCLYLSISSLFQLLTYSWDANVGFLDAMRHFPVPFAMLIYGFVAITYPVSLCGYHLFLTGRGETTREYLKSHNFLKKDRHRAFNQHNVFKNWLAVFLRPRIPSYLRFKDRYEEGDPRFAPRAASRQANLQPTHTWSGDMEMQDVPSYKGSTRRGETRSEKTSHVDS